jgi:cytochrome c oxidase cbb3-type subunit 1
MAANGIGILLATLLIWPQGNALLAPYTYGRWMPLHMDWQLYGWCSLPLLGLTLLKFLKDDKSGGQSTLLVFSLWSFSLLIGGVNWLWGHATGKLFLNWDGFPGAVLTGTILVIWTILLFGWIERIKHRDQIQESSIELVVKGLLLLLLLSVPVLLLYTSDPAIYPPVNPESGGATGHSLLASTLGIVALMGSLPKFILKLEVRDPTGEKTATLVFWTLFTVSILVYALIQHGDASHRAIDQYLGLGSLLLWPPLVCLLWSNYAWKKEARFWHVSFYAWWGLLAVNGVGIFVPGILDTLKFTNALVAHSHLAMAGMVSALNMVILCELGSDPPTLRILCNRNALLCWNVGCLVFVIAMTVQGWREGLNPAVLFTANETTTFLYSLRLIAGLGMALPSFYWFFYSCSLEKRFKTQNTNERGAIQTLLEHG